MYEDFFLPRRLAQWNPTRGVWETGQMDLLSGRSELFAETWPTSGMTRNGVVFELPTPVLPTEGSASSSLPTPQALPGIVRTLLPTPTTEPTTGNGHARNLGTESRALLPTPAAMNPYDGEGVETWEARRQRVKATGKNGNGFGTPLAIAVQLLPTPVASEGTKATARQGSAQKALTGQVWLTNVAHDLAQLNGAPTNPPSAGGSE